MKKQIDALRKCSLIARDSEYVDDLETDYDRGIDGFALLTGYMCGLVDSGSLSYEDFCEISAMERT